MSLILSETELATLLAVAALTKPVGPTTTEVSRITGLTRVGTLRIAKRLAAAGIVVDHFPRGGQARLNLTPAGRRALRRSQKGRKNAR